MSFEIVVIGASSGGLQAIQTLLAALPADFPLPIVIVQHRRKDSELSLCEYLSCPGGLPVTEPEDKEAIFGGQVYLAPRDYHLLIDNGSFALSTDPPVGYARPSIDVLFESVAAEFRHRTIGIILTGKNRDGAHGLARIKAYGGFTLVEDPRSASAPELPRAAIALSQVDRVLPLAQVAPVLEQLCASMIEHHGV